MKKVLKTVWKKFWRPILRSPIIMWILMGLAAFFIWFLYWTSKHRFTNTKALKQYRTKPVIFVFFHGRSLMLSPAICMGGVRAYCIVSRHQDGHMMAKLQRFFGLRAIYGSTSEGAISILRQGVRVLTEKKKSLCLSVDGPSGPSLHCQDGALYFARVSGAPIVPCCFSASRAYFMKKWDRFLVPKPFGTITCRVGEPIYIDPSLKGEAFEQKRKEVEQIMVNQLREMDAEFNLFQVEQGITAKEFKEKLKKNKNR